MAKAADVNSAGLAFGLAFGGANLPATVVIAFTNMAQAGKGPSLTQQPVTDALGDDTQVVSNTQREERLAGQPKDVQAEIIRINPTRTSAGATSWPRASLRRSPGSPS